MNATTFHTDLLGRAKHKTPEAFWLLEEHEALYAAFDKGKRGYSSSQLAETRFLATAVLALALTEAIRPVYIFVPEPRLKWSLDQIEELGRHVMRARKKMKDAVLTLRSAFHQLRLTALKLAMEEPDRWVMFGFRNEDILPAWAQGRLLELEEPRSTGAREIVPQRIPLPPKPKVKQSSDESV